MKTKILFVMCLIAAVFGLTACNEDNSGSMNVGGDCFVEYLTLNDKYIATINTEKRLIKVKVPVDFNEKEDMVITSMKISDGAKANIKVGDHINLRSAQDVIITTGNVVMTYQLSVRNDEAKLNLFILEGIKGAINEEDKTVNVAVTGSSTIDLGNALFEALVSEDAVCLPASGTRADFKQPFILTVKDNTAESKYTVNVTQIQYPVAVFVGNAETVEQLNDEEKAAAKWLMSNIAGSAYISWNEIADNPDLLKECKFVFFHRHSPSYGDYISFKSGEPGAMAAVPVLKELRKKGMGIVLQRSAVNYAIALGAQPEDSYPNNVWGGSGEGSDKMGPDPWTYRVADINHPLWKDLKRSPGLGADRIITLDENYTICNTTSQYGFWGDYPDEATVVAKTGARILGGDGNVSSWELKNINGEFGKGGIICFGTGVFDWNSPTPYESNYHDNMGKILMNAYNYLTGE